MKSLDSANLIIGFCFFNVNQQYLGRTYAWAKRNTNSTLAEASPLEWKELRRIYITMKNVLSDLFNPNRVEFHQLGNVAPHLHVHFIPRYSSSKEFQGTQFLDERWPEEGYAPYDKTRVIPDRTVISIRDALREKLLPPLRNKEETGKGDKK